jgi:phytoene dehydrogenase-like protein
MQFALNLSAHYDAIIVGGGHNGLVAAAYLARAGLSTLILERQARPGGAAVSARVFPGLDARLSQYAYLVSLFPQKIVDELGLRFESRRRTVASFTPVIRDGVQRALLVSNVSDEDTEASFFRLTGGYHEHEAFQHFYEQAKIAARIVWPSLLQPLLSRAEMKRRFAEHPDVWQMFFEQPLGAAIESKLKDDTVRGAVFTDAKIGVLTYPHDPSLLQNRTFLYHVIGNETGEWRVPVGGMGALTAELERAARSAGAQIVTAAAVQFINPGPQPEVEFTYEGQTCRVGAKVVLANVAPAVFARMLPGAPKPNTAQGSVFKINMLLKRLPAPRISGYTARHAFTGTFHIDEGYEAMQRSYESAARGVLPDQPPGEMYCHTLTDTSILSQELAAAGYHTLTLFGLDVPYGLFRQDNEQVKAEVQRRYLNAINCYLAEPIEACLAQDQTGCPCIEAKSPVDLERELNMPLGHIFHGDLTWPFAEDDTPPGTWGVETPYANVFLCGSGAQRGGCVSGIPGHNAAMKVLETLGRIPPD